MYIRYTPFNLATAALALLTLWLMAARPSAKLESNWPLFYYLVLVAHLKFFDGGLHPGCVYGGVVTALFLRFEFMGGWVLKLLRVAEMGILGYVVVRSVQLVLDL